MMFITDLDIIKKRIYFTIHREYFALSNDDFGKENQSPDEFSENGFEMSCPKSVLATHARLFADSAYPSKFSPTYADKLLLNKFLKKINNTDTTDKVFHICFQYLTITKITDAFKTAIANSILNLITVETNYSAPHFVSADETVLQAAEMTNIEASILLLEERLGLLRPDEVHSFQQRLFCKDKLTYAGDQKQFETTKEVIARGNFVEFFEVF